MLTISRIADGKTFTPRTMSMSSVRPMQRTRAQGVKQEPPLPVSIELARDTQATDELSEAIGAKLREELTIRAEIELVQFGSLSRSEYKSRLVEPA